MKIHENTEGPPLPEKRVINLTYNIFLGENKTE
jgi:hypothetical protein